MNFQKLPSNAQSLLKEIVSSDNPVELLCDKFSKATPREAEELRGILRELKEKKYVTIQWASNKPYHVSVNNSARTYEEQLSEYNAQKQATGSQSITIGNNNKISNSTIANNLKGGETNKNKGFYEKHPVICGFLISLVAGIVLLFSFWNQIITFIEGLF